MTSAATPATPTSGSGDDSARSIRAGVGFDLLLVVVLALLAFVVRWPYLWTVPRFTDETLEVLHSLAIVRDGLRPLTNYDTYYGALYNYLVAVALVVSGESPLAPRVVLLLAGVATVAATYLLGAELGRRLSLPAEGALGTTASRVAGLLAAGLLATNGPHVVVNSHIAWSNCLTPLLTTLAFWALLRVRDVRPCLPFAGLLLGLALQTHPLVVTLLPGIALAVLLADARALRTPWPWLAAVAFLIGYANMVAFNAASGFDSLRTAQRMQAEYGTDQQAALGYAPTVGSMLLLLARIVGGAVDQRESVAAYLVDPGVVFVGGLALVGLGLVTVRRELLPLLATGSFLLILPAANPKFQTLLTSRYLMPIVPLLVACAAVALVWFALKARERWPQTRRRPLLAALMLGMLLASLALLPLDRYYRRAFERTDTNERILLLVSQIEAARQPGEAILVDDSIGAELPDTGVTELRGLEYLLTFARAPYRLVRPSPGRLQDSLDDQPSVLAILNARDASAAAGRVRVESLDPRPPVESGRMFDFRLYRLSRARG